jgi:hypothetical protein
MKMTRIAWVHASLALALAVMALFLIQLHQAGGVDSSLGKPLPTLSGQG